MGVTGLWSILDSVGHPIKLDALEGKRLGVDANLWLYKFIRGFREKDNATKVDSHKLGLFNRISKLLFYKIKPIFVFDGPAPVLKRRTLERRQNLRGKHLEKHQEAAVKLFREQLKKVYPQADIDSINVSLPVLQTHLLTAAEKMTDDDDQLFYVPPQEPKLIEEEDLIESDKEDDLVEQITLQDKKDFKKIMSNHVDVDSPEFASLPAEIRYEVLKDVKESRKKIRRVASLPEDSDSFSKLQLNRLMARRSIQEKIEKCEKDICSMYGLEFDSKDQKVEHFRVQSSATSNILYVTNNLGNNSQEIQGSQDKSTAISNDNKLIEIPSSPESSINQKLPSTPQRTRPRVIATEPTPLHIFKARTKSTSSTNSQDTSPIKPPCLSRTPSPEPQTPKKQKTSPEVINLDQTPVVQTPPSSINDAESASSQSPEPLTPLKPKSPEVITLEPTPIQQHSNQPSTSTENSKTTSISPIRPNSPEVISLASSSSPDNRLPACHLDSTTWSEDDSDEWEDPDAPGPGRLSMSQPASFKPHSSEETKVTENTSYSSSQPLTQTPTDLPLKAQEPPNDNTTVASQPIPSASQPIKSTLPTSNQNRLTYQETRDILNEKNKSERHTNKVTTRIIEEAKELLRLFGVPYIDAAGEAEAQCAILESLGHTEGTITDDSDIWLFGAQRVYRHFFSDDKYVMEYKMSEIVHHVRMNRENLICLAMLVGSDYTDGVMNVGPVTALEILSEFQGDDMEPLIKFRDWRDNYELTKHQSAEQLAKKGKKVGNKKRETFLKFRLPEEFPSRAVFDGYMRPLADQSEEKFAWGVPDLDELREYARRQFDWDRKKIDDKLLPVMKKVAEKTTQKTIDSFFFKTVANENPELFRSKRVNQALSKISKSERVDGAKTRRKGVAG